MMRLTAGSGGEAVRGDDEKFDPELISPAQPAIYTAQILRGRYPPSQDLSRGRHTGSRLCTVGYMRTASPTGVGSSLFMSYDWSRIAESPRFSARLITGTSS